MERVISTQVFTATGEAVIYPSLSHRVFSASVVIPKDKLKKLLGDKFNPNDLLAVRDMVANMIANNGSLVCTVRLIPQDPHQTKDSRDHLVVEFLVSV